MTRSGREQVLVLLGGFVVTQALATVTHLGIAEDSEAFNGSLLGGRERSEEDRRRLLDRDGFALVAADPGAFRVEAVRK